MECILRNINFVYEKQSRSNFSVIFMENYVTFCLG